MNYMKKNWSLFVSGCFLKYFSPFWIYFFISFCHLINSILEPFCRNVSYHQLNLIKLFMPSKYYSFCHLPLVIYRPHFRNSLDLQWIALITIPQISHCCTVLPSRSISCSFSQGYNQKNCMIRKKITPDSCLASRNTSIDIIFSIILHKVSKFSFFSLFSSIFQFFLG